MLKLLYFLSLFILFSCIKNKGELSFVEVKSINIYKAELDGQKIKVISKGFDEIIKTLNSSVKETLKFKASYRLEVITENDTSQILLFEDVIKYKGITYRMNNKMDLSKFENDASN